MAKLRVLETAALLVALLAVAEAHTTTITITTIEEDGSRGSQQSCQEQIRRQWQQLQSCQRYLSQQQGSPYEVGLRMYSNPQRGQQQQQFQECCQQLENIDEQCRCEATRQIVRQQQQEQEGEEEQGQQQMQQVAQRARDLPRRCGFEPQQCQIRAIWF